MSDSSVVKTMRDARPREGYNKGVPTTPCVIIVHIHPVFSYLNFESQYESFQRTISLSVSRLYNSALPGPVSFRYKPNPYHHLIGWICLTETVFDLLVIERGLIRPPRAHPQMQNKL